LQKQGLYNNQNWKSSRNVTAEESGTRELETVETVLAIYDHRELKDIYEILKYIDGSRTS